MSAPAVHDAIAIGAGPFNLGFAALAGPAGLDVVVLEGRDAPQWHPGMMLAGTHLQVPFLADLVTLADPTHPLSFLAFLKDTGRIYPFYIREDFYALRSEYARYLAWAAERLPVRYAHRATGLRHDGSAYLVTAHTPDGPRTLAARNLILGTGTEPQMPRAVPGTLRSDPRVVHSSGYLPARDRLLAAERIAVVGSGQSAAEVFDDLLAGAGEHRHVEWLTRSPRFFPLEYTKPTLEMTSPDYIDHFTALPQSVRDHLGGEHQGLYKGVNADLLNSIYDHLYAASVDGPAPATLRTATALEGIRESAGRLVLTLRHGEDGGIQETEVDAVVLATGYAYRQPDFLAGVEERLSRLPDGRWDVDRGYGIGRHGDVFVQNAELHTHGFTAPDLGMGAYRNSVLVNRLCGREHYVVERRIAFQEFGTPGGHATFGPAAFDPVADTAGTTAGTSPALPRFSFRPVHPAADAELLHSWVTSERAHFWGLTGAGVAQVRSEHERIASDPHHHALIALDEHRDATPSFLLETHDPAHSVLAGRYAWRHGDAGLHLLLPEPGNADHAGGPESGYSAAAMAASLTHLFADPAVLRVVVEPDARNTAVQALNARCGFRPVERLDLPAVDGAPAKTAQLSFCTRSDFATATGGPAETVAHLSPARWATANRHLLAKALAEFTHERLLEPVLRDGTWHLDGPGVRYRFDARRYALDHWDIDAASLHCEVQTGNDAGWAPAVPDVQRFVTAFRDVLGLSAAQLPVYLEELGSTLASHCYKQLHSVATAAELAAGTGDAVADFQRIEAAMTEGHPCFVANNGRLGLGSDDYLDLAPETGSALPLEWVAAHVSRTRFTAVDGLDLDGLLEAELGSELRSAFRARLEQACRDTGLDPADFLPLPVHPWQWRHRLSVTFAADVATGHLVHLGATKDLYQPQQSIRTFFNHSAPERHYVKTALSVLNMGFLRGLSAEYMDATPAINDWLQGLFAADPELDPGRVQLLREVAAVGYANPLFHAATERDSAYRKMLAALWRESPATRIGHGEQLATMASLLHTDADGASLAAAYIRRSGLGATEWLERYLDAYLVPLLHCLVRHDLVFMPHGENVILVLRDGAPERVLLKDLAEEVAVLGSRTDLPPGIERLRAEVAPEDHGLSILTDIVDCFLRFLAPLLDREGLITEGQFWAVVTGRLTDYRSRHPETADRFDALRLLEPTFRLSCLNRLQLRNNRQMVDLTDPAGSLAYAGDLSNPLAGR